MEKLVSLIKEAVCKATASESPFGQKLLVAALGEWMKKLDESFSCMKYGEKKLLPLLKRYPDLFEIEEDNTHQIPRHFVTLKGEWKEEVDSAASTCAITQEEECYKVVYIHPSKYEELASLAMPEDWSNFYKGERKEYGLLQNYIRHTFNRLLYENKIVYSKDGKYAAFHTGLADMLYRDIYALLTLNRNNMQKWFLDSFCVAGEGVAGKKLQDVISPKPERAYYFSDCSKLFYDTHAATPDSDRILKAPIWPAFSTWVPPQNSTLKSPTETTRTTLPYFSPN